MSCVSWSNRTSELHDIFSNGCRLQWCDQLVLQSNGDNVTNVLQSLKQPRAWAGARAWLSAPCNQVTNERKVKDQPNNATLSLTRRTEMMLRMQRKQLVCSASGQKVNSRGKVSSRPGPPSPKERRKQTAEQQPQLAPQQNQTQQTSQQASQLTSSPTQPQAPQSQPVQQPQGPTETPQVRQDWKLWHADRCCINACNHDAPDLPSPQDRLR
jgi:hypothetical protein